MFQFLPSVFTASHFHNSIGKGASLHFLNFNGYHNNLLGHEAVTAETTTTHTECILPQVVTTAITIYTTFCGWCK